MFLIDLRYSCVDWLNLSYLATILLIAKGPTGAPQNLSIIPGDHGPTSREVTFFWDLPLPSQRNGIITSYTISCSPDTETLPVTVITLPGTEGLTVGGFQPFTEYSCMIFATNSLGSGPPALVTTRTNEDGMSTCFQALYSYRYLINYITRICTSPII